MLHVRNAQAKGEDDELSQENHLTMTRSETGGAACPDGHRSQRPGNKATSNIKPINILILILIGPRAAERATDRTHTRTHHARTHARTTHTHTHASHAHHTHTHTRSHAHTHTHTHTQTIRSDCMRYTRVLGAGDLKGICVVLLCASIFVSAQV